MVNGSLKCIVAQPIPTSKKKILIVLMELRLNENKAHRSGHLDDKAAYTINL